MSRNKVSTINLAMIALLATVASSALGGHTYLKQVLPPAGAVAAIKPGALPHVVLDDVANIPIIALNAKGKPVAYKPSDLDVSFSVAGTTQFVQYTSNGFRVKPLKMLDTVYTVKHRPTGAITTFSVRQYGKYTGTWKMYFYKGRYKSICMITLVDWQGQIRGSMLEKVPEEGGNRFVATLVGESYDTTLNVRGIEYTYARPGGCYFDGRYYYGPCWNFALNGTYYPGTRPMLVGYKNQIADQVLDPGVYKLENR